MDIADIIQKIISIISYNFLCQFYVVIFQTFAVSLLKLVKPRWVTVSPDTGNWLWFCKRIAWFH